MKKLLLITLCSSVCSIFALAQTPNSDQKVAAIENHGDPMPGVFITLEKLEGGKEGLASQVMTDAQGNFEFKNIAPGKYIVTVGKKHIGGVKYEDMKFTVVSPRDSASGLPTGKR